MLQTSTEDANKMSDKAGKKEWEKYLKGNRTAKLKQCKLDARREQWLSKGSQGVSWKQGKVEQQHPRCENHQKTGEADCAGQESAGPSGYNESQRSRQSITNSEWTPVVISQSVSSGTGTAAEDKTLKKDVAARNCPHYFADEDPLAGCEQKKDTGNGWSSSDGTKSRSSSSCASSSYNGSGSEDNDESHDAEDDWESAFDALHIQGSTFQPETPHKGTGSEWMQHSEAKEPHSNICNGPQEHHPDHLQGAQLKPEYKYKSSGFGGRRGNGGRAWRLDDISRPPTLPRLTKQHTYPGHQNGGTSHGWGSMQGNMWGPPSTPSYCPICTEELDMTDSSYMPCSCGFQLCLFCYHRISSDDGRCPGCRKAYNSEVAVKLSHSSSVWLRVSST
ncbi:unnamed protein product [Sphagnum compactum]